MNYNYLKINVIGNTSVGKTSIVNRYVTGFFNEEYKTTVGSQFTVKVVPVSEDESARVQIWDISDKAQFNHVRKMYYGGTSGIIIVYDITREESFKSIQNWINEIVQAGSNDVPIALVGNKVDLTEDRAVESDRGAYYADTISEDSNVPVHFFETSAWTGEDIDRLFNEFVKTIFRFEDSSGFFEEFYQTPSIRVKKHGWTRNRRDLSHFAKEQILEYLGFPELSGLLVTTKQVLEVIPDHGSFNEGITNIQDFLMKRLEQQIKNKGPTFGLDIDTLRDNDGARFVNDILTLRFNEIRFLAEQINSESEIDPRALWNTYYGRMLIKSTDHPQELDINKTKHLLLQLEDSGIAVGLER